MNRISVIIPVFNAYDDVKKCVESILKYVNNNRVFIINDRSTDHRVSVFLNSIRQQNVIIINNDKNLGFTKSVNIGMKASGEDDVVLLNSDTVVTRNWLEKLALSAYSKEKVATVTPLSNNATICSVPIFMEENLLPLGYSVDNYAELVERVSKRVYPEIPTAHGYCMYIKREALNKVGFFNEELFKKGYGEENDFSFRAINEGYINIMCDDVFIYHKGTASFKVTDKDRFCEEHLVLLESIYPNHMKEIRVYIQNDPNRFVRENIDMNTKKHEIPKTEKESVLIFGIGKKYKMYKTIVEQYFNVNGYIDNYKCQQAFEGEKINSPRELEQLNYDYILIMAQQEHMIVDQLVNMKVERERILDFAAFQEHIRELYDHYNKELMQ